jgi:phasin family protein
LKLRVAVQQNEIGRSGTPQTWENKLVRVKSMETAQAASETAQEVLGEAGAAASKGFDETVSTIKHRVAAATVGFEKTQEQVKEQMDKALRTAEELVTFGQGNLEAMIKSSQIWLAGVQDLSKQVASNAQEQVDATVSALRALTGVRSPKEAMEVQANLARNSFEKALTESRRLTDSSVKLAEQAVAPIAARVTLAFEKFGRVSA